MMNCTMVRQTSTSSAIRNDSNCASAKSVGSNVATSYGAYARVLEINPENTEARAKNWTFLLAGGRIDEASAEATTILAARPDDPDGLVLRGLTHKRQEDTAAAEADARAALKADPGHKDALVLLAGLLRTRGLSTGPSPCSTVR